MILKGIAPLIVAGPDQLSWLSGEKYRPALEASQAGAVMVPADFEFDRDERPVLLRTERPELAMALAARLFLEPPVHPGRVMEGAVVDSSALVAEGATVYPLAVVEAGAEIGEGAVIHSLAYVGPGVKIGPRTVIQPQAAVLSGVEIGADCLIQAGTVIGADGFRFVQDQEGAHVKIPQMGTVKVEDKVELGANAAVDRAFFGPTLIGRGSKIDNLVQVAHNVRMGPDCALAAQVGISGSTSLGRGCILAGQVGLADHIKLGDRVMIGAQAGVAKSIPSGEMWLGTPAGPARKAARVFASWERLPDLLKRVRALEKKMAELEAGPEEAKEE
jgi:UDP-3-O-[3-hydroxymyristoyl] glucosamine N-acyltransferase